MEQLDVMKHELPQIAMLKDKLVDRYKLQKTAWRTLYEDLYVIGHECSNIKCDNPTDQPRDAHHEDEHQHSCYTPTLNGSALYQDYGYEV